MKEEKDTFALVLVKTSVPGGLRVYFSRDNMSNHSRVTNRGGTHTMFYMQNSVGSLSHTFNLRIAKLAAFSLVALNRDGCFGGMDAERNWTEIVSSVRL